MSGRPIEYCLCAQTDAKDFHKPNLGTLYLLHEKSGSLVIECYRERAGGSEHRCQCCSEILCFFSFFFSSGSWRNTGVPSKGWHGVYLYWPFPLTSGTPAVECQGSQWDSSGLVLLIVLHTKDWDLLVGWYNKSGSYTSGFPSPKVSVVCLQWKVVIASVWGFRVLEGCVLWVETAVEMS